MNKVVPLHQPHTHRTRGDVGMEHDRDPLKRPTFETQVGNTTIKIRSALPFMTPDEQERWWIENDSLPEVQRFKKARIAALINVAKAEASRENDSA
ncbi:hypothetical protein [Brevibacillus choshinensis]|uniref:Uncharacterized protein n=1 Tax=Brevibacillus choshinensis TaxID=54911 RepID=A0ABX7FR28_BRECH|nr:hypothetical protein [Brevibacillus choshinensis]QRG68561.1 hypothetical protein JNE38_05245 [Brevibacillus choshinensis]